MGKAHAEQFVSEPITPVPGTADVRAMARGEPGLPGRFTWRGREYRVAEVIQSWKTSGPCRSGGGEVYLRRHWHKILTEPCQVMKVYCERQARSSRRPKARWWLYSIEEGTERP
ncbi:MAG TPA: DUF6504 family protein [Phycisphaerae bacterium]|nr:DUF6504 family protein [Phycisphaerae bacterium]